MKQILLNYISNAVKFTKCGSIKITASLGDYSVNISVKDSGIGIIREDQTNIFKEYSI